MGLLNKKLLVFVCITTILGGVIYFTSQSFVSPKVDFNADVRPILNKRCMSCHGGVKRSGKLSLLTRDNALLAGETGNPAIVPGDAEASELIFRINHSDPEMRMPLDGPPLTQQEIDIITKWVNQGAEWKDHWSFIPLNTQAYQQINDKLQTSQNGIDYLVKANLSKKGLSMSPAADKSTLIRRVSLDLTGVPPSLDEARAFEEDDSPEAYERVVDRLLASPKFGEKWAAMWLDLARYGDSQGYQKDKHRTIWQYRDWVIDAFNQDMPFDQFTKEQLAGDLLPDPTVDQLIATAFHRNTMANDEGGTDDEEFRVAAVIDRINTTFEVWQGITISCVQCHGHPYDPILHEEYYELMAFFNNTADTDKPSDFPNLRAISSVQKRQIEQIEAFMDSVSEVVDTASSSLYASLKEDRERIRPSKTPIMQELGPEECRSTHVFERGNWLVHGKEVQPDVPGTLSDLPVYYPQNRLGLAQWLVSPENPLTSRVIVNRFWEQLFGIGIVETLEDFGTQGIKPSNQELLDWLANEFMYTHQWSVKSLLKQIVMSDTYRQRSNVSPMLLEKDPRNKWLARGPRFRLSAEQIRDQALAVSGLLSDKMYGPSVMPPQPEGVWNVIRHVMRWESENNEDRYRRGLYTYWRRSSPYPSMVTFDVPSKEFCVSRRIRTNTPLQALTIMNDTVYLEASQALAKRMMEEGGTNPKEQISFGYEVALFQSPPGNKLETLMDYYEQSLAHYESNPADAEHLLTMIPTKNPELASLTNVANVILNLDEFITKE